VPGDGNCLFTSFSIAFNLSQDKRTSKGSRRLISTGREQAPHLRRLLVTLMASAQGTGAVSLPHDPAYAEDILSPDYWGGEPEIAALAKHYKVRAMRTHKAHTHYKFDSQMTVLAIVEGRDKNGRRVAVAHTYGPDVGDTIGVPTSHRAPAPPPPPQLDEG
jgi:hypothetical protein